MRKSNDGPIPESLAATAKHIPAKRKVKTSESPSKQIKAGTRSPKKVMHLIQLIEGNYLGIIK